MLKEYNPIKRKYLVTTLKTQIWNISCQISGICGVKYSESVDSALSVSAAYLQSQNKISLQILIFFQRLRSTFE